METESNDIKKMREIEDLELKKIKNDPIFIHFFKLIDDIHKKEEENFIAKELKEDEERFNKEKAFLDKILN